MIDHPGGMANHLSSSSAASKLAAGVTQGVGEGRKRGEGWVGGEPGEPARMLKTSGEREGNVYICFGLPPRQCKLATPSHES